MRPQGAQKMLERAVDRSHVPEREERREQAHDLLVGPLPVPMDELDRITREKFAPMVAAQQVAQKRPWRRDAALRIRSKCSRTAVYAPLSNVFSPCVASTTGVSRRFARVFRSPSTPSLNRAPVIGYPPGPQSRPA